MVYKHAISTVVPARAVSHHSNPGVAHPQTTTTAETTIEASEE